MSMRCPHCQNNDLRLLERLRDDYWRCEICSKTFERPTPKTRITVDGPPFDTLEEKRGER